MTFDHLLNNQINKIYKYTKYKTYRIYKNGGGATTFGSAH